MAYGDSILDAAIKTYQPVESTQDTLQAAQGLQMGSLKLKAAQGDLEQQQMDLSASRELTPLQVALKKAQAKNSLFSNAIATAPDAETWDANMRALADKGVPEAEQYIGRYSPVLQQRLQSVYGGQQQAPVGMTSDAAGLDQGGAGGTGKAAGGASAAGGLDYQFANTTPEQRAASLDKLSTFAQGLEQVKDPDSWNALKMRMHAAGIPMMDQLGDYSPIKAASIYSRIQPVLSYLQNRAIADQAGIPQPKAAPDIKEVGGQLYSVDPYNGTATAITQPKPEFQPTTDAMGNPQAFNKNTGKISPATANDGVFGFDDFAKRMNGAENSTGNRGAQNPLSSATGNGQFIDSTWIKMVKLTRPELVQAGMTDKQMLELRKDPGMAQEMTAEYAKLNAQTLAQNGQPVNATTLALSHRFDAKGALSILNAAPDAKLSSILPADVIKANPSLANQTAGDYVSKLGKQVGMDPIGAPTSAAGGFGNLSPDLHGQDLLAAIPQTTASQVKALAEGRMAFPSGFALKSPYWQSMLKMVGQYDPNFDAVNYNARSKTRNWITSGQGATTVTALNTALGHAAGLADNFDKLGNTQFPMINSALNFGKTQLGNAQPTVVRQNIDALASEGRKVFATSGGGNLTELDNWKNSFPINGSPDQQKGALKEFVSLLDSRMNALADQYNRGMGTTAQPLTLLSPTARAAYSRLTGEVPEGAAASGAAPNGPAGGGRKPLSPMDQQAITWANANPRDPRAVQIKAKLGM